MRLRPNTVAVLAYLAESGPSTVEQIAGVTGLSVAVVRYTLSNRRTAGEVVSSGVSGAVSHKLTARGRARLAEGVARRATVQAEEAVVADHAGQTLVCAALARRSPLEVAWGGLRA